MQKSERVELYEKFYFHELDRRDKIASRLSTPLGALIGTAGILAFLLNSSPQFKDHSVQAIFWLAIASATITLLIGGWYFRKAWFGHADRHVATAADIDAYHVQLETQYKDEPGQIEDDFSQFLLDTYRRSATTNAQNNDKRSIALYRAGCWLTSAIILALLSTIPYYFGRTAAHERAKAACSSSATTTASGAPCEEQPKSS